MSDFVQKTTLNSLEFPAFSYRKVKQVDIAGLPVRFSVIFFAYENSLGEFKAQKCPELKTEKKGND